MKRKARKYALYFSPHSEKLEPSINILSSANFLAFLSWRNFSLSYCAQDQTAADKNDSVSYKNEETSTESEVGTSILNTIGCSVVSLKIFFLMFNECQGGKYFKCYSVWFKYNIIINSCLILFSRYHRVLYIDLLKNDKQEGILILIYLYILNQFLFITLGEPLNFRLKTIFILA